jgi:hypothetical protein
LAEKGVVASFLEHRFYEHQGRFGEGLGFGGIYWTPFPGRHKDVGSADLMVLDRLQHPALGHWLNPSEELVALVELIGQTEAAH